ncbi:MAG: QueT transporter family protein [Defluviitaleaceae bacterium]|nr:QueT transporter family protein [Defluviitaleaceae bacterium]
MKITTNRMAIIAITAALYAAVTLATPFMAFGPFQFRIAEMLTLLAYFNPIFVPGVLLGTLIANLFSPYGLVDIIFGTLATAIVLILIRITKRTIDNLLVSSFWPVIINAIVIPFVFLIYADGIQALTFEHLSWAAFLPFAGSVAFGQFVVVTIVGYIVIRIIMAKFPNAIRKLESL